MGWRDTLRDITVRIAPRADAVRDGDGIYDAESSGSHLVPAGVPWLTHDQRRWVAQTGIGRRVVRAPADLAVSSGWDTVSGDDRDVSRDVDRDLGIAQVVSDAHALARQDGLAWVLVIDDTDDPSEPLREGAEVLRLMALTYEEVQSPVYDRDPASERFGDVTSATVTIRRPRVTVSLGIVHHSRLVRVAGLWRDPTAQDPPGRVGADLSAIEAYWYAISDYEQTGQSIAEVARMMAIPWLEQPGILESVAAEGRAAYQAIIRRIRRGMGTHGLLALAPNSKAGVLSPSLAGIGDVEASQYRRLTAVEGAPADWLLDLRVGGLGADSEGRTRLLQSYADGLHHRVTTPVLLGIYDAVLGPDPARTIEYHPVVSPSPLESADVAVREADAASKRVMAGITSPMEEREHLSGDAPWRLPAEDYDPMLDEPDDAMARALAEALSPRADADPTDDDRARTYRIPEGAAGNARRALAWRDEHDLSHGTATGWARARQLAEGGTVTGQDVIEMSAWFARHEGSATVSPEYRDEPWRDAGYVMWLAWGGDTARTWVDGAREAMGDE